MNNKKITVLGYGKSGQAVAKLAQYLGYEIFISDSRSELSILSNSDYVYELGQHSNLIYESDIIIVSPGISDKINIKKQALLSGVEFISEIEFASMHTKSTIIGITGSNGKTTTSKMLYNIINNSDKNVMLGGNIGIPFSENVLMELKNNITNLFNVVEVSSFQLEDIVKFSPHISCLLNISEDHLDRYNNDLIEYAKTKFKIIQNFCDKKSMFIFNHDDPIIKDLIKTYSFKSFYPFSKKEKYNKSFYIESNCIFYDKKKFKLDLSNLKIPGEHNYLNVLATLIICDLINVNLDIAKKTLIEFQSIPHRLEYVCKYKEINFYNDSKATNISSTIAAVKSFSNDIILILGGIDKSATNFQTSLKKYFSKIRVILCYGQSGKTIYDQLSSSIKDIYIDKKFDDMLDRMKLIICNNDNVILSPGCTSFDQFKSFEERGNYYKKYIHKNFTT